MILALARPQWQAPEAARQPDARAELALVIDYSEAMLASDLKPSRLERIRSIVRELLAGLEDSAVALIGYAGDAHLLAPMSRDKSAVQRLLANLAPEHFLDQGANLNRALVLAMDQFSSRADKRLILVFTVGERGTSTADDEAPVSPVRLRSGDIDLLVVGAGTVEGAPLLDAERRPRVDTKGAPRITRLDRQSLQALATQSGGRFVGANDQVALRQALTDVIAVAGEKKLRDQSSQLPVDVFVWLLLGAMLMLIWSLCCEFSGRELLAWRWRYPETRFGPHAAALVIALTSGVPDSSEAQELGKEQLHAGDPYIEARAQIQGLAANPRPDAADYQAFAEVVVEYALFHRGHAEPVIESLISDGFIAIAHGRALNADNPAWGRLEARLTRLAQRAPATRPPDLEPGDPANEQADADVTTDIADDPAPSAEMPDTAEASDDNLVGGGQAEAYDPTELTNPALVLPLHQLQAIRERATPADLFRAQQENEHRRQNVGRTSAEAPQ